MRDLRQFAPDSPELVGKDRIRVLASRQFGVVARHQLRYLGVPSSSVADWANSGELHSIHPGVYAVGHTALSTEARLTAAVLYAGPGAMLSHGTAAWWLGLTERIPPLIHVSTPRRPVCVPGVLVHGRRGIARTWHRALPIPWLPDVLLDYASTAAEEDVRYVLAQADYHDWLDLEEIAAACGRGRPGSAKLRAALAHHLPQLAVTDSEFERRLLYLCERHHLPLAECNVHIEGFKADAVWREQKVIVELDGKDGHGSWERIKRDHHRDLVHRRAGFVVLRYVWEQFTAQGDVVAADIAAALAS